MGLLPSNVLTQAKHRFNPQLVLLVFNINFWEHERTKPDESDRLGSDLILRNSIDFDVISVHYYPAVWDVIWSIGTLTIVMVG